MKSRSLYHVRSLRYPQAGSCHKADCIAMFRSLNLTTTLNTETHSDRCYTPCTTERFGSNV